MPPELRKAHQENDKAVMKAYGFSLKMTESECVAELFKMYEKLTQKTCRGIAERYAKPERIAQEESVVAETFSGAAQ